VICSLSIFVPELEVDSQACSLQEVLGDCERLFQRDVSEIRVLAQGFDVPMPGVVLEKGANPAFC